MTQSTHKDWWPKYQSSLRFVDGGRDGNLVDCYGMARQIYVSELGIELPAWPLLTLDQAQLEAMSFAEAPFTTDFMAIQMGLEASFDMAVIRRPMPVGNKLLRGWWHVGVITKSGHVLHIDQSQGVVEVAFRDTALALQSGHVRVTDVRIFRHIKMLKVAA
jgi:hypothetical protein